LIILIALAALAVGGVEYRRRAARYRLLAVREAAVEREAKAELKGLRDILPSDLKWIKEELRFYRDSLVSIRRQLKVEQPEWWRQKLLADEPRAVQHIDGLMYQQKGLPALMQRLIDGSERRADYHTRRRAAFLRCARYPWLSPPAEEPEPE
jgi:hypothetical protein